VPEVQLSVLHDGDVIEINGLRLQVIDTPGHADHHNVYLMDEVCFSGDIGGVRLAGSRHLRLPMPPPEFHLEKWRASLNRLYTLDLRRIAPTHFGLFDDVGWHLAAIARELDTVQGWIETTLPENPDLDTLTERFLAWVKDRSQEDGVEPAQIDVFELANPSWMSPLGIQRYWRKYRSGA